MRCGAMSSAAMAARFAARANDQVSVVERQVDFGRLRNNPVTRTAGRAGIRCHEDPAHGTFSSLARLDKSTSSQRWKQAQPANGDVRPERGPRKLWTGI